MLPPGVKRGGYDPRLCALVAELNGTHHLSHQRMRPGVRFPAWSLLLVAVLGLELRRPPSDSSFRYFFLQVDAGALCTAIRDWTIAQIPGGATDLDQLVCDGKTLRCLITAARRERSPLGHAGRAASVAVDRPPAGK